MRTSLIAVLLLALAAPAALAHPERHAFFPDGSVGAVPKYRNSADQVLTVCKKDSAKRIRRSFRHQPKLERKRLRQLKRCHSRNIQAAVNKARSGAIIRIMPGVYREQPSRKAPEPDPRCANDYDEIGSSLLASGVAGNGGGAQGRQLRVPAQVPERPEPDRDHRRRAGRRPRLRPQVQPADPGHGPQAHATS